jgi:hypothetical protein
MGKKDKIKYLILTGVNALISGGILIIVTVLFPQKLWLSTVLFSSAFIIGSIIISRTVVNNRQHSGDQKDPQSC